MTALELRTAAAEKFRIEYPEALPVSQKVSEIKAAWQNSQLIIVGGETGSGKTTQLPKIALELGCGRKGRIGCTQPRRIAASAMANRLAHELHCSCGKEVGSQVRFEDRTTDETVLKFILGEEDLANFDAFVNQANEMGLTKCIELQQKAYDEFLARSK